MVGLISRLQSYSENWNALWLVAEHSIYFRYTQILLLSLRHVPCSSAVSCHWHLIYFHQPLRGLWSIWYFPGQRNVWCRPCTRAWDQQHGGGEHATVLYLPQTRHQLLHDVSAQHHGCCFSHCITCNGCSDAHTLFSSFSHWQRLW